MIANLQNVRLCVDGRMLGPGGTGVATYARSVAAAHRQLSPHYLMLADDCGDGASVGNPDKLRRRLRAALPLAVPLRQRAKHRFHAIDIFRLAQVYFDVHRRFLTLRPPVMGGVMHWSYPLPLRMAGWLNVYTIHDAIPLTHPSLTSIDPKRHERLLRRIASVADGLVTVSDAARNEITTALSLPPDKVANCSQPVMLSGALVARPPAGLSMRGYLVVIGTVEPRKNIVRLLEAYAASGASLPLVLTGPVAGDGALDLEDLIRSTAGTIRLPYTDGKHMPALLAGARALVMPSLAEGFGLPVIEAMTLGTPVITSSRGALREIAGDAALLVDPEDVASIAAAIRQVAFDEELCAQLTLAGRHNAERFTPDRFVKRLGAFYERLIAATRDAR